VIDLGDARVLHRVDDTARVAGRIAPSVPRIDEQGLARGRDVQRRASSLDVDQIDLKRLRGLSLRRDRTREDAEQKCCQGNR